MTQTTSERILDTSTSFLDMSAADIDRMLEIPDAPLDLTLRLQSGTRTNNASNTTTTNNTTNTTSKRWWNQFKWGTKWNRKGNKQNAVVSSM